MRSVRCHRIGALQGREPTMESPGSGIISGTRSIFRVHEIRDPKATDPQKQKNKEQALPERKNARRVYHYSRRAPFTNTIHLLKQYHLWSNTFKFFLSFSVFLSCQ